MWLNDPLRPTTHRVLLGAYFACVLLAALLLATATPADAAAPDHDHGVDLSIGFVYASTETSFVFFPLHDVDRSESEFDFGLVALRYHHRFSDTWGLEASLAFNDELTSQASDAFFLDVSARWTIHETERIEVYGVFGPGLLLYDRNIRPFDDSFEITSSDETPTAHAGVGALFDLGSRAYLRTDVRIRSLIDVFGPLDEESFEATVGLGLYF